MEKSISWLEELLALQGLKASVSGSQNTGDLADDSYWLTINTDSLTPEEVNSLVGDRGQVLDSIQYLANITLNIGQSEDEQRAYTIEINGYRKKRQAELQTIADEAAKQVAASGEEYEIKGLSAAERRQVHGLLGDYEQLETFSRGREPDRHLVVKRVGDDDSADGSADDSSDSYEPTDNLNNAPDNVPDNVPDSASDNALDNATDGAVESDTFDDDE